MRRAEAIDSFADLIAMDKALLPEWSGVGEFPSGVGGPAHQLALVDEFETAADPAGGKEHGGILAEPLAARDFLGEMGEEAARNQPVVEFAENRLQLLEAMAKPFILRVARRKKMREKFRHVA